MDADELGNRILYLTPLDRLDEGGQLCADVRSTIEELSAALRAAEERNQQLERLLTEAKPWVEAHQEYESTEQDARALTEQIAAALTPPPKDKP